MDDPNVVSLQDIAGVDDAAGAAAFEEFFDLESDRLYGVLVLLTGDRSEAEEIAQDAFVAVWERWGRVRLMESPEGYLHRAAINIFRKRYRRAQLFGRLVGSIGPRSSSDPPDAQLVLSEALLELTPRQRAALVLTELLGYSADEAGRALGVKASTIRALKHQGRTALRREADRDDD